jgi:hypothetical protein
MVSVVPPAGAPTKILMGGCDWAWAQLVATEQAKAKAKAKLKTKARRVVIGKRFMGVPLRPKFNSSGSVMGFGMADLAIIEAKPLQPALHTALHFALPHMPK